MAAIAVMAEAMQMLNNTTIIQKRPIFPTLIEGRKNRNRAEPVNDNARDKKHVNKNFPKNTSIGVELSFNRREVPRSSSMTKVLERPVMLPKNKTIHNNAEATLLLTRSPAVVNAIVEIVITINNNNADSAIRDRNSIDISFRNTAMHLYRIFISVNLLCLNNDHIHDLLKNSHLPFAM
jgi:hypothetical protein